MLQDLIWVKDKPNQTGVGTNIYIAAAADISSVPAYNTYGDVVLADDDIVMVSGGKFYRIYSPQGSAKFNYESVGEKDGKLFKLTVDLQYPDIDEASKNMAMAILQGNCVLLVPTFTSERTAPSYVMVGGYIYSPEIDSKASSGDTPGSQKGLNLTMTCFDIVPGRIYEGSIRVLGGDFDCLTGVFTNNEYFDITITKVGNGTVTPFEGTQNIGKGTEVTVTATETDPDCYLESLKDGETVVSNPYTWVVDGIKTITANFLQCLLNEYDLQTNYNNHNTY